MPQIMRHSHPQLLAQQSDLAALLVFAPDLAGEQHFVDFAGVGQQPFCAVRLVAVRTASSAANRMNRLVFIGSLGFGSEEWGRR